MKKNANRLAPGGQQSGKPLRILAIDPGTREIGVAVLDTPILSYHGVESISCRRSPHLVLEQARAIIERLLKDYCPDLVVYENSFIRKTRRVALLNVLADEIKSLSEEHGIDVRGIAVSTVRRRLCGNGRATKDEVAKAVVARFPVLKIYLNQDRKWKNRFHANMFDAVALALCCEHGLL